MQPAEMTIFAVRNFCRAFPLLTLLQHMFLRSCGVLVQVSCRHAPALTSLTRCCTGRSCRIRREWGTPRVKCHMYAARLYLLTQLVCVMLPCGTAACWMIRCCTSSGAGRRALAGLVVLAVPLSVPAWQPGCVLSMKRLVCVCAVCRFPLLFHSIVGKDEQELQSPSWFNVQEAKLVVTYVEVGACGRLVATWRLQRLCRGCKALGHCCSFWLGGACLQAYRQVYCAAAGLA